VIDGRGIPPSALESELVRLARKSVEEPARLDRTDLDPLRELAGDGALDFALVLGAFHFVNRIADLLDVDAEALPETLRRFEWLRRLTVSIASRLVGRMDLANRPYPFSFEDTLANARPVLGATRSWEVELEPIRARPKIVEHFALALAERERRSSLDRATLARIHATVEGSLPASIEEVSSFHPRPPDPVEAFAFVGTRHPARTTRAMIDALRERGYGDLGILDLATAIADANAWARLHRLFGLKADLFYVADGDPAKAGDVARDAPGK